MSGCMVEGAQDFLIRGQVDCAPLAHALANAMEREQIACAEQTLRFVDLLTGLPNHGCFNMFAERDRKIAELLGTRWMILPCREASGSPYRNSWRAGPRFGAGSNGGTITPRQHGH